MVLICSFLFYLSVTGTDRFSLDFQIVFKGYLVHLHFHALTGTRLRLKGNCSSLGFEVSLAFFGLSAQSIYSVLY